VAKKREVPADGACFYWSISSPKCRNITHLRNQIAGAAISRWSERIPGSWKSFGSLCTLLPPRNCDPANVTPDTYSFCMIDPKSWAGPPEIFLAVDMGLLTKAVICSPTDTPNSSRLCWSYGDHDASKAGKTTYLLYSDNHFGELIPLDPSEAAFLADSPCDCDEEPDPEPAEVVWHTPPPRDQQEAFQTDPILQMQAPGILSEADLQGKIKHTSILGGILGGVHDLIEGEVIRTINPTNNSCLYITLARGMGFHRAEDQAECLRQRIVRQVISESGEDCNPEEFPNYRNWRVALEDIGYLDTDEFYDNRVQDALLSGTGVSSEDANIPELAAFSKICWGSKGYFSVKWCNRDTTLPSQPLRVGGSFDCGFQDAPVIYVLYCYRHVDLLVVNSEDHKRRFT